MSRDYAASLVGRQFGDYRIEGVLGRGGMGAVLRGRDVNLGRDVALKIIGQEFGGQAGEAYPAARDRFLREAKTLAGLAHPNLVHLYAVGEVAGKQFFAMELVRGPTLDEWVRRFGPLREAAAARFAAQMLSALNSVHATGYVHRDIKPGNMMLDCSSALGADIDPHRPIVDQLTGDEAAIGRWVLMDFGLAKQATAGLDSSLTQEGLILGTPDTISPEQAEGREVTRVSDLYSFGAVLFMALCGRLPFTAPSAMGVMQKHLNEPPPDLATFWKDAPAVWREVTARALQKVPARRFQAESEFAAALIGRVDDQPELRELARAPRRTGLTAATPAAAAGVVETTAMLNHEPHTRGTASARTVSATDQTIRDRPAAAGAARPSAAVTKPLPAAGTPATAIVPDAAGTGALQNQAARADLSGRAKWVSAGLVALVLLGLLLWWAWPSPSPAPLLPPPSLGPIPANAFWATDPEHPSQPVALHWVGLDPTSQTYEVELYDPQTQTWQERVLTHDQMMRYGELKKPAADDPNFPRVPLSPPPAP